MRGIGGNFHSEPQGIAFDTVNQRLYPSANNSGSRQVLKMDLNGNIEAQSDNEGGSTKNIQDGAVHDGKVYIPRGLGSHLDPPTQSGYVQRFDLDLNFEHEYTLPMPRYATALDFAHDSWWLSTYDYTIHQLSADFSTIIAVHDISGANYQTTLKAYGGIAWIGNYLFGTEHDVTETDIWYWDGATLTLSQELSTVGFDLHNGIAFDFDNMKLYGSSRSLSDDAQEYNVIIN